MSPAINQIFNDLQDDFYAEADEHLTGTRRDLLALESAINQPDAQSSLLDALFRHFHSIKGLTGMVGLSEAEQLAHRLESYLRSLREGQVILTPDGLEALIQGTHVLEQLIASSRTRNPPPSTAHVLQLLDRFIHVEPVERSVPLTPLPTQKSDALRLNSEESERLSAAVRQGMNAYRAIFTPSQALAERGVNVNTIRSRLQDLGELIHAAPRVGASGGITFDFIVAVRGEDRDLESLQGEGITWAPFTPSEPAQEAPEGEANREPTARPAFSVTPSNVVRVDLARLDDLMHMLGALIITRARLQENLSRIEKNIPSAQLRALQEVNTAFEHQLRDLREGIMRIRLVPVGQVFERMQFVVRDLVREYDKDIRLQISGGETEIDKLIVERIMDPLLHLVRNAASHGVETRAERVAAGKPPEATISLRAATVGDTVHIQVEDDGRGIDAKRVSQRARALGLIGNHEDLDMLTLVDILCLPGFSTREQADRTSGRGIGMSVVKNKVQELGGTLTLDTRPGLGTCFELELPLTLAIVDALICRVADQTLAAPLPSVREVMEISAVAIKQMENNEIIPYRGGVLPLIRLARIFHLPDRGAQRMHALVVGSGMYAVGLVVDRIVSQREIVVQSLADPLVQVPGIAGATELGDGRVVLIVDTAALVRLAQKPRTDALRRSTGNGFEREGAR